MATFTPKKWFENGLIIEAEIDGVSVAYVDPGWKEKHIKGTVDGASKGMDFGVFIDDHIFPEKDLNGSLWGALAGALVGNILAIYVEEEGYYKRNEYGHATKELVLKGRAFIRNGKIVFE